MDGLLAAILNIFIDDLVMGTNLHKENTSNMARVVWNKYRRREKEMLLV